MPIGFITGASSGLGREFARALAARGYDLVITARRTHRLEELRQELQAGHGVEVDVLGCDLTDEGQLNALLSSDLLERPIDVFINNAGLGRRGLFADLPHEEVTTLLSLNVTSHTRLLHRVYTSMSSRGKGGIINVASVAGFGPMPWLALYGASKSFVLNLSLALAEEGRPRGITVTALCPGPVDTEFFESAGITEFHYKSTLITPDRVVSHALDALEHHERVAIPRLLFRLQRLVHTVVPEGLLTRITGQVLRRGV